MEKDLKVSVLLDFYGSLLTEKQFNCTDLYYNEDFSLAEISEHEGITRQGVRDSIKHAEEQLNHYEKKLGLIEKQRQIDSLLDEIKSLSAKNSEIYALAEKLSSL